MRTDRSEGAGADRRAVLFDIDGVLAVSWRAIPGAAAAIERLRAADVPIAFITNTTSRSRAVIGRELRQGGIPIDDGEILAPTRAAVSYLSEHRPGARCLLLNDGWIGDDLEGLELVEGDADVVILGAVGPSVGYEQLNHAFQLLREGAELVAFARNWYFAAADGFQLDTGAFVIGLERAAGVEATVVGKPAPAFFQAALDYLGVGASEALMVGDDLESDVLGAQAVGISGVLVRTGKFSADDLERSRRRPDHVLDSVVGVPGLLGLRG